jgi:hypothetical protein
MRTLPTSGRNRPQQLGLYTALPRAGPARLPHRRRFGQLASPVVAQSIHEPSHGRGVEPHSLSLTQRAEDLRIAGRQVQSQPPGKVGPLAVCAGPGGIVLHWLDVPADQPPGGLAYALWWPLAGLLSAVG